MVKYTHTHTHTIPIPIVSTRKEETDVLDEKPHQTEWIYFIMMKAH